MAESKTGRRIVVHGPTGSGKSTVARLIGGRIGVPVVELDAIRWLPNWVNKPQEEFRTDVIDALNRYTDGWVVDGNYSELGDIILPRADVIMWLRPPWRVAFWRLLRRTLKRAWAREVLWETNQESLRSAFLSRDSILLYSMTGWKGHVRRIQQNLREIPHGARVIELRTSREVGDFIESLGSGIT